MASELAGGSKLTQFVANHILGNVYGHMLAAVMDSKGVADEFGEDGGGAAPGLDDALLTGLVHRFNFLHQRIRDVRALFGATRHILFPPLTVGALHNELVGASMMFASLEPIAGLPHGVRGLS